MELKEIKEVIISQAEEIIERRVDKSRLKGYLSYPNILAILGMRRCGNQSYLYSY